MRHLTAVITLLSALLLPRPVSAALPEAIRDSLEATRKSGTLMEYYLDKESELRDKGEFTAIIEMSDLVEKMLPADDLPDLLLLYGLRAACNSETGDYRAMFADIEKTLETSKDPALAFNDAYVYLWIMDFHLKFDRLELGRQYLDRAKSIARRKRKPGAYDRKWRNLDFQIHFLQGHLHRIRKNFKAAEREFDEARKYILDERQENGLNVERFYLHNDKGEYTLSDSVYGNYLEGRAINSLLEQDLAFERIRLLLKRGETAEAARLLGAMDPARLDPTSRVTRYGLMSEIYASEKNYPLAYECLAKSDELRDSLESVYQKAATGYMADRFEMNMVENSLKKERRENIRHIIFITLLCLALAGAGIWVAVMIRRHRRRKRDQLIAESSLGNRNAALSSAVMVADSYKKVCEEIKTILSTDRSPAEKLTEISARLKDSSGFITPLHQVSATNGDAMQEFVDKLRYVHPDLTNAEMRMAQLVVMNISNKDIAELQNRSLGTIKNQKYSLRKKLGTSMPMETYLRQLSAASAGELEALAEAAGGK